MKFFKFLFKLVLNNLKISLKSLCITVSKILVIRFNFLPATLKYLIVYYDWGV